MATIRLKAIINKDGITQVKSFIKHPMETGTRKDLETGDLIPAHFIEEVKCEHNGRIVVSAIWSGRVSTNPYYAFKFKEGKVGDTVKLTWTDNQGQTDSKETQIKSE